PGAAALLLLAALPLLAAHYLRPGCISPDDYFCVSLCRDVVGGRGLEGWHLPGAPYLFPDDLLLLACEAVTADQAVALTLYPVLFYLTLLAGLFAVARQAGLAGRAACLTACGGLLLLIATHLGPTYDERAILIAHPGSHVGAVLVGVFVLALLLRGLRRGHGPAAGAALVLLVGLGTFSDKLLAVQFLAPAAVALAALALGGLLPWRRLLATAALLAAGGLLAAGLQALARRLGLVLLRQEAAVTWFGAIAWRPFWRNLISFFKGQTLLLWLLPLHLALALAVAAFGRRRGPGRPAALFLALFVLLVPACNLGALLAAGTANVAVGRYVLACVFAPFLFGGLLWAALPGRAAGVAGRLLPVAVVLFAAWRLAGPAAEVRRQGWRMPYLPLAQALDRLVRERGPLRGLAHYWVGRGQEYQTRERVLVNTFVGVPFSHGDNPDHYLAASAGDLGVPDYRFVVVGEPLLGPGAVRALFGEPAERTPVGDGTEVWLYDCLDNDSWTWFLRAQVARRLRRLRPHTGPAWPPELARPKRNQAPSDGPGTLTLRPGQTVVARFDPPVTGTLLDLGADFADRYDLTFCRGAEPLATVRVPNVLWTGEPPAYGLPGVQARLVPLPAVLGRRAWDHLCVTARPGHGTAAEFRLAHLLVYQGEVPRLCPWPAPGSAVRRFEAEALPTGAAEGSRAADPEASGGAVRRCGAAFAGCLTYGPYLRLPAGRYRVDFAVKVDHTAAPGRVATLEVSAGAGAAVLARRDLGGADFTASASYDCHGLTFETADELSEVEFRLRAYGGTGLALDYVELTALPPRQDGAPR
ncbi:MAG TPA: hypothetical protein VFE78_33470, partial [Gemmataceae bacterium]|nr:hypothetical protein [Gemmataceae bacterium]